MSSIKVPVLVTRYADDFLTRALLMGPRRTRRRQPRQRH